MPTFTYSALDNEGKQSAGSLAAESRTAAMDRLTARDLFPVSIEEGEATQAGRSASASARVSRTSVDAFIRELANLLAAGVPLSRALSLLKREASQPAARARWSEIHDDVIGGTSLADALARWPKTFPQVHVAMVRAGEAGGFLELVLSQIADFRFQEQELKGKVKAALIYPIILASLAGMVLVFLLTYFIPRFSILFAEFGGALPWLTQMIVMASRAVLDYGPLVLFAVLFGTVFVQRALLTETGRRALERLALSLPIFGRVVSQFALVRFCRMLGTLIGAGVPLISALKVARESIGNQILADAVSQSIEDVQKGTPL
ncbi:MAG: type II secretion system F family protein, partial [Planctomycetota bacterium]|nr:type II secretion system F family protein [Planctomycetota bacterium]